jgi:hypothetical protein
MHYRVIEKEINQIVNDWYEEWRTPVTKTMQQETQLEKCQEEEEEKQRNGEGDAQEIPPPVGEKRKEHMKEQSMHKHKKRK